MGREASTASRALSEQLGHGQDMVDEVISSEQTPAPMLPAWLYSCCHLLSKKWEVWGLDLMDLTRNPETCTHRH